MDNKFSFFAPAYLKKSSSGKNGYKIYGVISSETRDTQNEVLLTKGLDLSYLENGWGKIKYEHDNFLSKEPDNIIGFPERVIRKGGVIEFEGSLIPFDENVPDDMLTPQQRATKSAVGLMKAIEEYNALHPDKPQKIGFSVEGEYLERDRATGIVMKARVRNVVLTTKPVNTTTFAKLVKSLSVGYGVTPETQTGFGATRLESIDGYKQQFYKGDSKMVFKDFEEAKKYFLSQGLSEEEAIKKAKEVMEKQSQKTNEGSSEPPTNDISEVQKSVAIDSLKKSIAIASSVEEVQPDFEADTLSQKLIKSVETLHRGDNIDLSDYFTAKQETDVSVLEGVVAMLEKQDLLAKSIVALAQGLAQSISANENTTEKFAKALSFIAESQKLSNQALLKSLKARADFNFAPSDLMKYDYVDNNAQNDDDVDLGKMNKSVIAKALYELAKDPSSGVTAIDVSAYEGFRTLEDKHIPLVKAKIKEMINNKK